jgi:transcriptional regulator with XRE-family HTH domain
MEVKAKPSNVLQLPSCRAASDDRHRSIEGATPTGEIVEVVGFNGACGHTEQPFHDLRTGNDRINRALDLTDVRLTATQFGSKPLLGSAFLFSPRRQLQSAHSQSGIERYSYSLYLVNGHKQFEGAEYKQMAYVLSMHPANRLRELRKAAGLSQIDLAQRSGVSQPYISQVENQAAVTLDIARMRALARDLKCVPADLLSDDDNPDRLSDDERVLIQAFRSADPVQRELLLRLAQPVATKDAAPRKAA